MINLYPGHQGRDTTRLMRKAYMGWYRPLSTQISQLINGCFLTGAEDCSLLPAVGLFA